MSIYKQQELDFVIRTKIILKQYEEIEVNEPNKKYEDTLFINCLLGLLIIPQQHWFDNLPTQSLDKEWGITASDITIINNKKNIDNISRHLRNSISHYRFTVLPDKVGNIEKIEFIDFYETKDKKKIETFKAIISIKKMRVFAEMFSNYLIEKIKMEK